MNPNAALFFANTTTLMLDDYNHVVQHLAQNGLPTFVFTPDTITDDDREAFSERVSLKPIPFDRRKLNALSLTRTMLHGFRLGRAHPCGTFTLITSLPHLLYGFPLRLMNRRVVFLMAGMGTLFSSKRRRHRFARFFGKRIYRLLYSGKNSRVIVQNRDDRAYAIRHLRAPSEKVFLMRGCGADREKFPFFAELPSWERPVILVPARLIVEKGVFEAVAASRILNDRGIDHEFRFSSDIDPGNPIPLTHGDLRSLERDNPSIRFVGYQPVMAPLYQDCHIVCLPSYREGLPSALIEASACGRPIVTTDTIGCREIVSDGENGLLVPVRDAVALADALTRLIQNPGLAESLRQNAYRRFLSEFTKERSLAQTLVAYRDLGLTITDPMGLKDPL